MSRSILVAVAAAAMLAACGQGGGLMGGGDAAPLQIQFAHRNGVVLQVTSVRTSGDQTVVGLRAMNGRDSTVRLSPRDDDTYLATGSGEQLPLVKSPSNPDLSVLGGQTIEAELVFTGALPRGQAVTLVLNDNGDRDGPYTNTPAFRLDLPADGIGRGGPKLDASRTTSRVNVMSTLGPTAGAGSSLGGGGTATSRLERVEALRAELGAVQTARGTVVALPGDVLFDFDKATIRTDAEQTLRQVAELISAGPAGAVRIEGHTDSEGEDAYNQRLSEQRAASVRTFLTAAGVPADRLTAAGLGETRPAESNTGPDGSDDEAARQRNRRVEIILPNAPTPVAPAPG